MAGCVLLAQTPEQLVKIKSAVEDNLDRLPNYTCTESIQRFERPLIDGQRKLMMSEAVRLEVAFVDGSELFGWPGASKMDEADIGKMIDGSIGNGYFGLFSQNVFSAPSATYQYVNDDALDGKPAVHYDYHVPKSSGLYVIRGSPGSVVVGFHGSFWVNPATLDLIRMTVTVDDPPVVLGISATSSVLDFERKPIGSSSFVLPRAAQLLVVDTDGMEKENRLSFAGCHQFVGESVLKFDVPASEPAAAAKAAIARITLPDDFTVDFNLDTPIEWGRSAGGDPVRGTLRESVGTDAGVVAPKGAVLSGRIAHLALRGDLYYVQLKFNSLDFNGGRADLDGRRNGVSVKDFPLIYTSTKFKLARGARLTLHSRLLKSVHNDSIRP